MPIQTTCPSCGRPLRVPDNLIGANVKCPGCQTTFLAGDPLPERYPMPAEPPPSESPPPIPSEAVREQTAPTEQGSAIEEGIRKETGPRSIPLPPPPDYDEEDDEEDEEDIERMEEARRRRRRHSLREQARSRLNAPGIGLIVTGILALIYAIFQVVSSAIQIARIPAMAGPQQNMIMGIMGVTFVLYALSIVVSVLIIRGAIKMRRLQSYGLAMTASILALLPPHDCCVLGLVFGVWTLIVLNDVDVKGSFVAGPLEPERRQEEEE